MSKSESITGERFIPTEGQLPNKKTSKSLRYQFKDHEIISQSKEMAEYNNELARVEQERKRANSQFKAEKDRITAAIGLLSDNISTGYEMRSIEVDVFLNTPKDGEKTLVRSDNGTIVEVLPMSSEENQMDLPFGGEEEIAEDPEDEEEDIEDPDFPEEDFEDEEEDSY